MGIINAVPGILDPIPGGKTLVNMIDYVVNWARANSLWPLTYGTSCCAIEMMSASMARYDIARFGSEVFRASPRQADLFILAGTITERMAPAIQMLWEQIPGPKYSIAMGSCTISGGPFVYDNYAVVRGAGRIMPVDVFVPGCPPRPEALFHGLLALRDKILKESFRNPWQEGDANPNEPDGDAFSEARKAWEALEKIKDEEMAEARAKFKEENPDYKSPFKAVRVQKEAFPAVPREAGARRGLSVEEVLRIAREKIPAVTLRNIREETPENLAAIPTDAPIDLCVPKKHYMELIRFLKEDRRTALDYLIDITAVDFEDHFDVIVQLLSTEKEHQIFIHLHLDKETPENPGDVNELLAHAPSLVSLYPAANWKEREVFDMFGIGFENHPDLRRIFLDKTFDGYPLRKNFTHSNIIRRPV
ncbi:MAG: NADH-quinone oxidoreductase subunit NuoB [Fibrobacter sp.]|jgi:NADH-quinone oxidoreductase B subunit|nr:NADH-quinone oxidoreductase subunit NuoB [Fibrobacter sp.]